MTKTIVVVSTTDRAADVKHTQARHTPTTAVVSKPYQMWPFYKPMKDGTMDFFGVCPIDKYEPQSNALLAHTYSPENADAFSGL